jgi:hypothetical protein
MKKVINVVAAIIENEEHEILCALRSHFFYNKTPRKYL